MKEFESATREMKKKSGMEKVVNQELLQRAKHLENIAKEIKSGIELVPEKQKELLTEFFSSLDKDFKIKLKSNVNQLYQEMATMAPDNLLVRSEDLEKILKNILEYNLIELEFRDKRPYANAAEFGSHGEGVATAFGEVHRSGFIKTLIGFNPSELRVLVVSQSECDLRDRSLCRMVEGRLSPNQIKYLILRIPRLGFPEEFLTEEEKKSADPFIFRGTKINISGR